MAGDQEKGGYSSCYSDQATHLVNQLQSFNHDIQSNNPSEIYNLTTSMEMWKGFISNGGESRGNHHGVDSRPPSSSKVAAAINQPTTSDFYQINWHNDEPNRFLDDKNDDNDPSNLRSCVFPCEANERPSQGLSLSLSSSNPSSIGLQSFELRHQQQQQQQDHDQMGRFFIGSKPVMNIQHQQGLIEDGLLEKTENLQYHQEAGQFQIRGSKYLGPAQELLNEFCNLGTSRQSHESKLKLHKSNQWEQDDENTIGTSSSKHSLYSLEFLDLQKRKTKLLQMLEEVDRRYKHYYDQMKAVVSSFEAVAGNGTATVYSALASKAMSRHFRCLRDGIVCQIKSTKKAMGEKDTAAPGGTRGETPRLRVLDQTLRQQRVFQQMNMMESHPWRPQRGLPERSVSVLRAWLFEHFLHPYPSDVDKHILARQTGLSRSQVSNWFINARVRLWKPMVEEMYVEEIKEDDNVGSSDGATNPDDDQNGGRQINQIPQTHNQDDQKPTPDQLVRIDSECLSSIVNNPERNDTKQPQNYSFGRIADSFGAVELDFSSYNGGGVSYSTTEQNVQHNFNGGGVSLTLGLQQHRGGGVSLSFSPTSHQTSIFYPREHIEECQQVQYSLLDGEGQNLPYGNLMGAQLLHDLAG